MAYSSKGNIIVSLCERRVNNLNSHTFFYQQWFLTEVCLKLMGHICERWDHLL